jgi:mannan endo-1,6-alpha-mannosidase
MATATQLASYTAGTVYPLLATTATAAASFCNQGTNDTQCTMWWTTTAGPATIGVGQQMSALNVFNANMMKFMTSSSVTTANTGGTSEGNPDAGSTTSNELITYAPFLILPFGSNIFIELHLRQLEIRLSLEY